MTDANTMRAVIAREPGDADVLHVVHRDVPTPGPGEVLIAVRAAGVNRADIYQRQGFYDPPPGATDVLGLECAGDVVACGPGVTSVRPGDRVCALLSGGGYAEQVVAPEGLVVRAPDVLDINQAGALMEAAATVWSNVFWVGGLQPGETLLVHGGASGIGTMAIQVAKAVGATVVVTAGSQAKLDVCRDLGADVLINYRETDFADVLAERNMGVDVILDIVAGPYLEQNVRSLAVNGRLVVIGLQGGPTGELDLGALLRKRATVAATSLRARPDEEKARIVAGTAELVFPLIEQGLVAPIVHRSFSLAEAAESHRVLEASSHTGKVILTVT